MKRLEQLNAIADEMLGGLSAGQELHDRILRAARRERIRPTRRPLARLRPALAIACALVLVAGAAAAVLPGLLGAPGAQENLQIISNHAAGQSTALPLSGESRALLDVPPGSITLSVGSDAPAYRSVWAPSSSGTFPLVCVEGRYYRLLRNPSSIGRDLLGSELGTVDTYTSEPAIAGTEGIISNAVPQGETVYAVRGMSGALAAAKVDGTLRVFQRVSFGKSALLGGENLSSVLSAASNVVGLELTGVGTIVDSADASSLFSTLLSNATYEGARSASTSQSLLIQLSNGLVVQMAVKDETLYGCGAWVCPEFFEAFNNAL